MLISLCLPPWLQPNRRESGFNLDGSNKQNIFVNFDEAKGMVYPRALGERGVLIMHGLSYETFVYRTSDFAKSRIYLACPWLKRMLTESFLKLNFVYFLYYVSQCAFARRLYKRQITHNHNFFDVGHPPLNERIHLSWGNWLAKHPLLPWDIHIHLLKWNIFSAVLAEPLVISLIICRNSRTMGRRCPRTRRGWSWRGVYMLRTKQNDAYKPGERKGQTGRTSNSDCRYIIFLQGPRHSSETPS